MLQQQTPSPLKWPKYDPKMYFLLFDEGIQPCAQIPFTSPPSPPPSPSPPSLAMPCHCPLPSSQTPWLALPHYHQFTTCRSSTQRESTDNWKFWKSGDNWKSRKSGNNWKFWNQQDNSKFPRFTTQVFEAKYCGSRITFVQWRLVNCIFGFCTTSPISNLCEKTSH